MLRSILPSFSSSDADSGILKYPFNLALLRDNFGRIAMLNSSATQWQHKFRVEIIMEKGQINLNGILSGSKSYGDEKIEIIPKFTKKNKKGRLVSFKKDLSWDRETKEFINALKKNQKIKTGNIEDAKKVMNLVDKIYKSDKSWKY